MFLSLVFAVWPFSEAFGKINTHMGKHIGFSVIFGWVCLWDLRNLKLFMTDLCHIRCNTVDGLEIPFPTTLDVVVGALFQPLGICFPRLLVNNGSSTTNLPPSTGELSLSDFLVSLGGPSRFSGVGPSGAV